MKSPDDQFRPLTADYAFIDLNESKYFVFMSRWHLLFDLFLTLIKLHIA